MKDRKNICKIKDSKGLRLLYFSDWRMQPIEFIANVLDKIEPVDLIVYGGDDTDRFCAVSEATKKLIKTAIREQEDIPNSFKEYLELEDKMRCRVFHIYDETDVTSAIKSISKVVGPPINKFTIEKINCIDDLTNPWKSFQHDNWFLKLAEKTRLKMCLSILGNDCHPDNHNIINVKAAKDIYRFPQKVGRWGFIGLEGGITHKCKGQLINGIGDITHKDSEVLPYLEKAISLLDVVPRNLIIVSHTPPAGSLDIGIRFGLNNLGSPSLEKFIIKNNPALVLCGHCHSQGGKSKVIGNTLIVNAASSDNKIEDAHIAVIELRDGEVPELQWVDLSPHSVIYVPGVGQKAQSKLAEMGITKPEELFRANDNIFKAISFGRKKIKDLYNFELAFTNNRPVFLTDAPPLNIPDKLLFFDVETGIGNNKYGDEPWIICAKYEDSDLKQWVAPNIRLTSRRKIYREFLDFIAMYENTVICYYSSNYFDKRVIKAGIKRCCSVNAMLTWDKMPEFDLFRELKKQTVFPFKQWTLNKIAHYLGFTPSNIEINNDCNGYVVGFLYQEYLERDKTILDKNIFNISVEDICNYNKNDVLMLEFIVKWLRNQTKIDRIKS